MKSNALSLTILLIISFVSVNAMSHNKNHIEFQAQDSIHKVWKFKKAELIKATAITIDNYDTWDLTNKDTLKSTSLDSPGVVHSAPYKIVNNAIVLPFPETNNITAQFKIAELTSDTLKLIIHVTYDLKGKTRDEDLIALIFEAKK